jgi:hypothetical protein
MKYFIWFAVVVACLSIGGVGVGYKMTSDFEGMMGIPLSQLQEGHAQCQKDSGEQCKAYGGFAPLSMF